MKKIFLGLGVLVTLFIGALSAQAYTVQSGDTFCGIAQKVGVSCGSLKENNPRENYNLIYPGEEIATPDDFQLGATPLPEDSYDKYITAPLSSSATEIFVSAIPTGVTTSVYTIFASDGTTVSEKVYCTGKSSSPKKLTGCVRGVATSFTDGVITEGAGTGVSHSKNSRIAITDNINFTGKALAILFGNQSTGSSTFSVGEASTNTLQLFLDSSGKYLKAFNNGTNPFIRYNTSTNKWQFSDDGSNTTNFATTSAAGLSASSTAGIGITDSYIHAKVSTTKALYFDDGGIITPKTSSTGGIQFGSDGVSIDRSDALTWTGNQTFSTITVSATSTLATTTVNGTDLTNVILGTSGDLTSFTAGETIDASTTPQAVYFNPGDGRVYNTVASAVSTTFQFIGFVLPGQNVSAGTALNVKTSGVVTGFTGLTAGSNYFLVNSIAGRISKTPGTITYRVARAVSTTAVIIDKGPKRYIGTTTFSATATTTITLGFRPTKVNIVGTLNGVDKANGYNIYSTGVWSANGGNQAIYMGLITTNIHHALDNADAWAIYESSSLYHVGYVTNITDSTFDLADVKGSTANDVVILWEAEG